ncbi:chromosome transmission fidelity protein 18 homolog [Carica papaya]|uniref:chromosome transmission fidelity protein 18 homolog n=1 Tax=Carica papaya TaxID=3649 RepID=UPI000B8D14CF|nr:chromosome transmission fidelity protein 18 homolog [Carica papaya]
MDDMDMYIPLPEELELLEANSHIQEDYLDLQPPEDDDRFYEDPQPNLSTSSSPLKSSRSSIERQINGNKRSRPYALDLLSQDNSEFPSDEKRNKADCLRLHLEEEEEDWLRRSPQQESNPGVEVVELEIPNEKIISRYASEIDGECIPITAPNGGDRVYARICRLEGEERIKKLNLRAQSNGLILEPINSLLQKAEQEAFAKALQASCGGRSESILPETPVVHEQLWVDKYAPHSFTELLSDEQTNRQVLLWLKQWDSCVFGSEIRSTSDEVLSALRRHSAAAQHEKLSDSNFMRKNQGQRWGNGRPQYAKDLDSGNSDLKRNQDLWSQKSRHTGPPEEKVLLLCGAPGLGKTTLAHVAAKHCGYHVVEVNASDERSSSTIEAKILDVVQMNSVTANCRPRCLVIDEIDGALGDGKGAVEVILKMVSADRKSDIGKENHGNKQVGRTSSKRGQKTMSLSRPVICICNDLYAPALRPLRQVAKVHIFVQPTIARVVSRLKYICNKEGMKTSSSALAALADYTECDIRSCLNTLQFLNKKKENLNMVRVFSLSSFSYMVFDTFKKLKKQAKISNDRYSNSLELAFLYSLISNRGDYDVIFDGIHENILQLQYHNPMMQKTIKCLNYLGTFDLLQRYIMRTQQMSLCVYRPALAISIHHLVSQVPKPNIEWPKSFQRYRTTLMEKMDILRSWHNNIPPYIGRHLSTNSFVEDSISPLLHILSPSSLRPVENQKILQGRSANLTDGSNKGNQDLVRGQSTKVDSATAQAESKDNAKIRSAREGDPSTSTVLSTLVPSRNVPMKKPSGGSSNYFDRFKKPCKGSKDADNATQKTSTFGKNLHPLLFKFNEGFTNAVKRPVRMREFL